MRFIHTSDWHLGKTLDGHSRLNEQEKFCEEFINIVNQNNIDMIIIAGDIYDTPNPNAESENLFYKTVSKISNNGQRCVLIISGNHDDPKRLEASSHLAKEQGIIILGSHLSYASSFKYKNFEIIKGKEGCLKLTINNEKIVVITLPYPSEKRLDELIINSTNYIDNQQSYSKKIGDIFRELEENFEEDTINIATSHLFVKGGESTESERPIEFGKSLVVEKKDLPNNAQYVALGHLHKSQKASERLNAYYSGSPLQYSKEERLNTKGAYIVDIKAGEKANIEQVYFNNYKPIEVFTCDGIKEAVNICIENRNRDIWSYFEIKTDKEISKNDVKNMKDILKDIIEIKSIRTSINNVDYNNSKEKTMGELFKEFYTFSSEIEPKGELMDLFMEIISEEGDI
ncbi:MAG: exonuclease subunit SbcD [Romboutsia sp.]